MVSLSFIVIANSPDSGVQNLYNFVNNLLSLQSGHLDPLFPSHVG